MPIVCSIVRMIISRVTQWTAVVLLLFILMEHKSVDSIIVHAPSDTTAMVNESTYFNCSTSIRPINEQSIIWFHFPLDGGGHRNYVYDDGRIMTNYKNRFDIEIDFTSGKFNLIALRLETKDAGRYECRDDIQEDIGASAELTVLASNLVCESDMNPGSVVGPTQCEKFIAPAEVPLSCSVPYNGGKAPQMTWSKSGDSSNSTITDCVTRNNRVTCNSTLTASLKLNGALYTCELKTQQYNCSLKINNILYVFSGNSRVNTTVDREVKCSANSSQSCSYTWKWFNASDSLTVSTDQTLKPTRVGSHRCEATCPIGNTSCTVDVMFAEVYSTQSYEATTGQYLWLLLPLLIIIMAIVVFLFLKFKKLPCLQGEQILKRWINSILDANEESFVDLLVSNDLLDILHSKKVINQRQLDFISSKQTSQQRIEALLTIFRRCSLRNYRKMISCLRQSNQPRIADVFDSGGVLARAHVHLDGPSETVTETEYEFIARLGSQPSGLSIEDSRRILERVHLNLIAVKKGQRIVLYIWCRQMKELLHLNDLLTNGLLKGSVEQLFNQFLTSPKTATVKDITMSDKEFRRWKKYFTDMEKLSSVGKMKVEPSQMGDGRRRREPSSSTTEGVQLMRDYKKTDYPQVEDGEIERIFDTAPYISKGLSSGEIRGPMQFKDRKCTCERITFTRNQQTTANGRLMTKEEFVCRKGSEWMALDHFNLIKFYHIFIQSQALFIVMEYAAGGSVREALKKWPAHEVNLPMPVVKNWARQIAKGMEYLHVHNIVHKNLNSVRILIMEAVEALRDKTLKISQFCLTDDEFRTHIQERFSYVAPEVLDGVYYKESDVWSFGIIVWEILTKRIPFEEVKSVDKICTHIGQGAKVLKIPNSCPKALQTTLRGCRSLVPSERPSFREILASLQEWQLVDSSV